MSIGTFDIENTESKDSAGRSYLTRVRFASHNSTLLPHLYSDLGPRTYQAPKPLCAHAPGYSSALHTQLILGAHPASVGRTLRACFTAKTEVTQAPGQPLGRKRRGKRGGRNQPKRPKEAVSALPGAAQTPGVYASAAAAATAVVAPTSLYHAAPHPQIPVLSGGTVLGPGAPPPLTTTLAAPAQLPLLDLRSVPQDEQVAARQYNEMLDLLTFNSKDIINNLTKIAGENLNNANGIVFVIEQRINNSAPQAKLPYLYLVDSILKNIGDLYVDKFSRNLFNTFRNVYSTTTPEVRGSLHRLLSTWPHIFAAEFVAALRRWAVDFDSTNAATLPPPTSAPVSMPVQSAVHAPSSASLSNQMYNTHQLSRARIPRVPLSRAVSLQPSYLNSNHPSRARSIAEVPIPRQVSQQQAPPLPPPPTLQSMYPQGQAPIGQQATTLQAGVHTGLRTSTTNTASPFGITPQAPMIQQNNAGVTAPSMLTAANGGLGFNERLDHAERLMAEITRKRSFGIVATNDEFVLNSLITDQLRCAHPIPIRQRFIDLQNRLNGPAAAGAANYVATPQPPYPTTQPRVVVPTFDSSALNNLVLSLPQLQAAAVAANPLPPAFAKPIPFANVRNTSHIPKVRALYTDLKFLSKSDGMRFSTEEEHTNHLDWLYARNRRMRAKQQKSGGLSRCWYEPVDKFLGEKSNVPDVPVQNYESNDATQKDGPLEQCVDARGEEEVCPVCCEGFTTFWHEQKQGWMIKEAVRNKNGTAFCTRCAASINDLDAYDDPQTTPVSPGTFDPQHSTGHLPLVASPDSGTGTTTVAFVPPTQ